MSLDTVELVLCWEEFFGIHLTDGEAEAVHTPRQTIDLIAAKLDARDEPSACPTQRAFYHFRRGLREVTADSSRPVHPRQRLRSIQGPRSQRRQFWSRLTAATGFERPRLIHGPTVGHAVEELALTHFRELYHPSELWTRSLVRYGVRAILTSQFAIWDFSDDDRFVQEMGLD